MLVTFAQIEKIYKTTTAKIKLSDTIGSEEKQLQISIFRELEKELYSHKAKYKASSKKLLAKE